MKMEECLKAVMFIGDPRYSPDARLARSKQFRRISWSPGVVAEVRGDMSIWFVLPLDNVWRHQHLDAADIMADDWQVVSKDQEVM